MKTYQKGLNEYNKRNALNSPFAKYRLEDDVDDHTHVDYKSNVVMKAGKYTDEELEKAWLKNEIRRMDNQIKYGSE